MPTVKDAIATKFVNSKDPDFLKVVRLLIASIKKVSYEDIVFSAEKIGVSYDEELLLDQMLQRYCNHEPISKIINRKSFWKHDFFVNEFVLDPRPETELIVEIILQNLDINASLKFLDLGTGSGCILLSILSEFQRSTGVGVDISQNAIDVANINKKMLNIDRAGFICSDWNDFVVYTKFDVIISNPPYIKTNDIQFLDENVRNFDPVISLDGGENGLIAYEQISILSKKMLSDNGIIICEIGFDQSNDVCNILEKNHYKNIRKYKDLSGIDRVVTGCYFL